MTERERRERHYDKIAIRWDKLKSNAKQCPECFKTEIALNESFSRKIRRFFIECESCHCCSCSYPTIKMAIRHWNKTKSPSSQIYK